MHKKVPRPISVGMKYDIITAMSVKHTIQQVKSRK